MGDAILTEDQLKSLLEQPDLSSPIGVRNIAIILLILEAGAKVGELVGKEGDASELRGGLRLEDLNLDDESPTVVFRRPRDGTERTVSIPSSTARFLVAWIELRPISDTDLVFVTGRGTRLQNRYVRRMLHDYGVAAGIDIDVKPSLLRHTFARRHFVETGDLEALAATLGHKHVVSSVRYLFGGDER